MKRHNLQGQVVALETEKLHLENEIKKLNNIINELEKELFGMYVDIAGWSEDYAKKRIKELEGESNEKN